MERFGYSSGGLQAVRKESEGLLDEILGGIE